MLKIMGKAQVSGRNYGQKIISILNGILSIKASNKTSKTRKGEYNHEYQHKSYQ